jgi:hypothetical protein
MAVSGNIASGFIKIALSGYDAAKKQLVQLQQQGTQVAGVLSNMGAASSKGFSVGTSAIIGFLKAADPTRFAIFQAKLGALSIHIGTIFIPLLIDAISWLDKVNEFFASLTDEQKESILFWTKVGLAIAAVGTAIGGIILVGNKLISFMKGLSVIIGLLEAETGIGLVLAFAGIAFAIFEMVGGFEALKPIIADISKSFGGLGDGLAPIKEALAGLAAKFVDVFSKIVNAIKPLIAKLVATFSTFVEAVIPIVSEVATVFSGLVSDLVPIIGEMISQFAKLGESLIPIFTNLFKTFMEVGKQIINTVVAMLPSIAQLIALFIKVSAVYQSTIAVMLAMLVAMLLRVYATFQTTLLKLFAALLDVSSSVIPVLIQVVDSLMEVFNELIPIVMDIINVVMDLVVSLSDVGSEILKLTVDVLGGLIKALAETFKAFWQAFGPGTISFIKGVVNLIKQSLEAIKMMVAEAKKLADLVKSLNPFGSKNESVESGDTGAGDFSGDSGAGGGFDDEAKEEKNSKESKDKTPHNFTPQPVLKKPEIVGLEEGFKKAQAGAVQNPEKIKEQARQQEILKAAQESVDVQKDIREYVKPESEAAGAW